MSGKLIRPDRAFFRRDTEAVARDLLGAYLVFSGDQGELVAEITETEAYLGEGDRACHSYGGKRTPRTENMYRDGGHSYIYLIYGMYRILNIITQTEKEPSGVMIRGAKPVEGLDIMARNRFGKVWDDLPPAKRRALMDGPGKLCKAMGLSMAENGLDMVASERLYLLRPSEKPAFGIGVGKRIGIDYAGEDADLPLRFFQIAK